MAILVRDRRHQRALRLSLPPPIPVVAKFRIPTYSPATSPATSPNSPIIESLSELEKLAVLGRGGGGTVYKVLHKKTSSIFALKVLAGAATREAEILRLVDSPFIVKCHGIFEAAGGGDQVSVLMEYAEEGSVEDLLRARRRLPEREISGVARRVLHGLRYLRREAGVVHGDLKPSNLLVGPGGGGEVKIADFGASHQVAGGDWSREGCTGTWAYMSPERFDRERWGGGSGGGGGEEEGFAGDVWSVGVVALECHVGRFPLVGPGQRPDWAALMWAVCSGERVEVPETASPELRSFLERCLEKDWRKRATVEELLQHPFVN